MELITVTLPSVWASALVNDDWSGLDYYDPEEAARARRWLRDSRLVPLVCDARTHLMRYEGLLTECHDYVCTPAA